MARTTELPSLSDTLAVKDVGCCARHVIIRFIYRFAKAAIATVGQLCVAKVPVWYRVFCDAGCAEPGERRGHDVDHHPSCWRYWSSDCRQDERFAAVIVCR